MQHEAAEASLPDMAPDEKPDLNRYDALEKFPEKSAYLSERQWKVCWYHVQGWTNNRICEALGYTPAWISTILKSPVMIEEINRLRAHVHAEALTRMKRMAWTATGVIDDHLTDPSVDISDKVQTAKWVFEQNHGKAKQSIETKTTYIDYVEVAKQFVASNEPPKPAEFREVAELPAPPDEAAPAERPDFRKWFDEKP